MESQKHKVLYCISLLAGILLIVIGLLLFIPRSVRSDTPDIYFYNIFTLRFILPISGVLLIIIGSSVYSSYKSLIKEIKVLKENYISLEKKYRNK